MNNSSFKKTFHQPLCVATETELYDTHKMNVSQNYFYIRTDYNRIINDSQIELDSYFVTICNSSAFGNSLFFC